jgi:amino acid transporter
MNTVPGQSLSLLDCICIIVGIILGVGIFETSSTVAACMGGAGGTLLIWLAGGMLALCGALCYAELASAYPMHGGDVVFLSRAYGSWAGFLFGWSQMTVIRPTDIALMAYIFGRYASTLHAPFADSISIYAAGSVVILTTLNIIGVRQGRWTQNILTALKIIAVLAIVVIGLLSPGVENLAAGRTPSFSGLQLGLILVLYTYGGWHELAYVAAEIREPRKNIVRALLLGTAAITVLYLLINAAFLRALGYGAMAASEHVAMDAMSRVLPSGAGRLMAVIICVSALGALNGMIFTGSRITYAVGKEYSMFRRLSEWHPRLGTPVTALLLQGVLSLGIVLLAGSFIDTILYSAPAVWLFFLGTGISLFVLRKKDALRERPFRVIGYPLVPAIFCLACIFMFCGSVGYAFTQRPFGLVMMIGFLGVGVLLCRRNLSR